MNVEETMLFILETQARTSENLEHITEKQKKFEVNLETLAEKQKKFDKGLDAIRKLIQTGMKMMVQIQQAERENKAAIKDLAVAQRQTERRLNAFLASMQKGRNGRSHT